MRFSRVRKNNGFTLVELLVVVAIIGIMASVAYGSLGLSSKKTRDRQRVSDMQNIQLALRIYKDQYGQYPEFDGGITIGSGGAMDTLLAPFFVIVPRDPLSASDSGYVYYYDSELKCSNISTESVAIFVSKTEAAGTANWEEVCGIPGIADTPGNGVGGGSGYGNDKANNNSYAIILR